MKTILTIIGARPQFVKAAALSRALADGVFEIREVTLHTGQHVSSEMSGVFFDELGMKKPDMQLEVSAEPAIRMGQMMHGISEAIALHKPEAVLLFGDTDSTMAGAWAASRLHIPVVHVEAGLRSFDRRMPEEINRIVTDHLSSLLFCPGDVAVRQLATEGIFTDARPGLRVEKCGDLMLDSARFIGGEPGKKNSDEKSVLLTLHRPSNVDDPDRLSRWMEAIGVSAERLNCSIVFPVHPRTQKEFRGLYGANWKDILEQKGIQVCEPAGYRQMMEWLQQVHAVWTDSGGLQKEAFFFHRPALVLRENTEWVELLDGGYAALCEHPESLLERAQWSLGRFESVDWNADIYGNGHAARYMGQTLSQWLHA